LEGTLKLIQLQENVTVSKYFVIAHLRINFLVKGRDLQKFSHSLEISSANSHYVLVYLLVGVCAFKYQLLKKQALHLYDR